MDVLREGASLLVKGVPGGGKTAFTLSIIEEFKEGTCVYVSTRTSRELFYKYFPWVRDVLSDEMFIDARAPQVVPEKGERPPLKYASAPEFMEVLYVKLKRKGEPKVAVIDSLDALKFNLKTRPEDLQIEKLLLEMAEATSSSIVLVLEGTRESNLEYIVDGIVTLNRRLIDGFFIREILLEKIRGKRIKFPSRLFTLKDGRFTVLEPSQYVMPERAEPPPIRGVKGEVIPTTVDELDRALGGGVRKGWVVALEVGEDVRVDYRWVLIPFFLNAVRQGHPVFMIPSGGFSWIDVRNSFQPFEERVHELKSYVHIIQFAEHKVGKGRNIYVLEGDDPSKDLEQIRNIISTEAASKGGIMFISTDTLEHVYGSEDMLDMVARLIITLRAVKHSVILVIKQGQRNVGTLLHTADVHFEMKNVNGVTLIQGKEPSTMFYAITVDDSREHIRTELVPVE